MSYQTQSPIKKRNNPVHLKQRCRRSRQIDRVAAAAHLAAMVEVRAAPHLRMPMVDQLILQLENHCNPQRVSKLEAEMKDKPSLEKWNFQVLMLGQALIGAVSANFRMVALQWDEGEWVLKFYLERHLEEDIEEIEDIVCQYTAYQNASLRCRSELIVGSERLPGLSEVGRVVYRRREST